MDSHIPAALMRPYMSFIYSSDVVCATKQMSQLKQEFHTSTSSTTLLVRNDQRIQSPLLTLANARREK